MPGMGSVVGKPSGLLWLLCHLEEQGLTTKATMTGDAPSSINGCVAGTGQHGRLGLMMRASLTSLERIRLRRLRNSDSGYDKLFGGT